MEEGKGDLELPDHGRPGTNFGRETLLKSSGKMGGGNLGMVSQSMLPLYGKKV